ncbi:hypothetical protein J2Z50_006298 [Ensifer mexicanus]|nr:hypothetical protein [Sinorhizobium mexicanum]
MRTSPTDTSPRDAGPTGTRNGRVTYLAVKYRGSMVLVVREGNLLRLPRVTAKAGETARAHSVPQRREPLRPEPMRHALRVRHSSKPVSRGVLAFGVLTLLGATYIHGFGILRSWLVF